MNPQNPNNVSTAETLPFLNDCLPEKFQTKAQQELLETQENKSRALVDLQRMVKVEKCTQKIDFHDDLLIQFLRQSKYDTGRAFKRLQAFVNFRTKNPEIFKSVDPDNFSQSSDYTFCTPLPYRCQDGCTIVVFRHYTWDPKRLPFEDLIRLGLIMCQQSLRNPMAQINGFKMIVDWKDCRLHQLKYLTPSCLYMVYQSFMDCTPARNKEIHMVNESTVMKIAWPILKPFLPEKLKKRIFFHSSIESMLNYFPKHILPVQYGGDMDNDYFMEDWMREANEQQRLSTLRGQPNIY